MKKSVIFIILSLAAVLATGCIEKIDMEQDTVEFTAIIDNVETKTELDENLNVLWQTEDDITVFYGSGKNSHFILYRGAGSTEATFVGSASNRGNDFDNNYAVYPYSETNELEGNDVVKLNIKELQPYKEGGFEAGMNPMVAKTSSIKDFTMSFRNVCGLLKVSVVGDKKITDAILMGIDEEPLSGMCHVNVEDMSVTMADDALTYVYVYDSEGVQLDPQEPVDFWFVVPPTVFEHGFAVYLGDTEGGHMICYRTERTEVKRSKVVSMSAITYEPEEEGDGIKDVTVEEFNAAEPDDETLYRISGEVTEVTDMKYGDFYITDATGTVYVYGISNWNEYKDGFAEGGQVVVVGNRGEYNGSIEVTNAYIESYVPGSGEEDDDWNGVVETDWEKKSFLHRPVAMRFTADWCGYCPMMAEAFSTAREQLSGNLEVISMHASGGLYFAPCEELLNYYSITSFPTGIIDGRERVGNSSDIEVTVKNTIKAVNNTESMYDVTTGVSWVSEINGDEASVDLAVYAKRAGSYKITALIVEDNIIGYQNGGGSNYVHNGVPRVAFTSILGEEFTTTTDNEVVKFTYSAEIPYSCNADNMRIVVYIHEYSWGSGYVDDYYINNSASGLLGESVRLAVALDGEGGTEDIEQGEDIEM